MGLNLATSMVQVQPSLLELTLEHLPDAVFLLQPDTQSVATIRFCNEVACTWLGYTREELLGRSAAALVGLPSSPREQADMVARTLRGEHVTSESLRRHKDGSLFFVEARARRFVYDGQPLILVVERKLTGLHLPERERLLEAAFDRTFEFIGVLRPDGILLHSNRTSLEFIGAAASAVVGLPFWEAPWWSGAVELQIWMREAVARCASGETVLHEVTVCGAHGSRATMNFALRPVRDADNRVIYLIPEAYDITEHKRSEELLRRQAAFQSALAACLQELHVPGHDEPRRRAILTATATHLYHALDVVSVRFYRYEDKKGAEKQLVLYASADDRSQQDEALPDHEHFPLLLGDMLWGYLFIACRAAHRLNEQQQQLITTVSEMACIAIRRWLVVDALQASEQRLRLALAAASLGLWEWNLVTKEMIWSEEMARQLGMTLADQNDALCSMTRRIHPEDAAFVRQQLAQAIASRQQAQYEFRVIRDDGSVRWLVSVGQVITDERGEPLRMVGISMDVTERHLAEAAIQTLNANLERRVRERTLDLELTNRALRNEIEGREWAEAALDTAFQQLAALNRDLRRGSSLLSTIINSLDDGLALIDNQNIVLMANQALARLYGRELDQILGRPWPALCPVTAPLLAQTFLDGHALTGRERLSDAEGMTVMIDLRTFPLLAADGSVEQVVLHVADINERLQFEELAIQNEGLAASSRLAAMVAHEVNSPLQAIQNFLYLATTDQPSEQATYVSLIREEIDRIGGLVRRLLDLQRPAETQLKPIGCNALIERVLTLTGSTLTRGRVVVERDLVPGLPTVVGRSDHLTQVLLNLILNALDAMTRGGTLYVRSRVRPPCPDDALPAPLPPLVVAIEVTDTGQGIDADVLPHIFEPFYTTKAKGSGLGLAISRQIIEQHQGRLLARNSPDGGAVFTIILPIPEPGLN